MSFGTCFKDRPCKGSHGCLEMNTIKLPEQLLVPEIRIIRDKKLFQITHGGRQNEFHRVKPFIVLLSKRETFFSTRELTGCEFVNVPPKERRKAGHVFSVLSEMFSSWKHDCCVCSA